jgi:hypothetical protein
VNEPATRAAEPVALPALGVERRAALREAWHAFWFSRGVVWIAGIAAVLAFGWFPETAARLDPLFLTKPFDDALGNLLVAPAARWDSAWYLAIAEYGYDVPTRAAFFPLFPALIALGGTLVGSPLVFGILLSSLCAFCALYLLHRLVCLDFDEPVAKTVVWIVAWYPSAIFLSAVYSEAMFLLLSIGAIYAARLGRWPLVGLLGALAATTRSSGILLILPLLVLYFYGPRSDRPPAKLGRGWRPRHRIGPEAAWICLVPAGLLAYLAYLGLATGDALAAFSAQSNWDRTLVPLGGIALGAWSAATGVVELIPGIGASHGPLPHPGRIPEVLALRDVVLFGFLVAGVWLALEAARRLPAAYTVHTASGLLLPLSVPSSGHALMSLPRFMFVLFPLWIALALWAHERQRVRAVQVTLGAMLAVWSGLFVTWIWAP